MIKRLLGAPRPLWTRVTGRATLLAGSIAIVLLVLISFPLVEGPRAPVDPAADAEATYRALLAQVDAGGTIPANRPPAAGVESAEASVPGATGDVAAEAAGGARRDLFAPRTPEKPAATAAPRPRAPRRPQRPRLPHLAGILIDGTQRRAMLGGELAAVGDTVGGYRVLLIERDYVKLAWRQMTYEIGLGAN